MDEDEPLDDSHLVHREGDGEEEPSLGWEWTEDDWRPAGMSRKSNVFQPRMMLNLPLIQMKTPFHACKPLSTGSSSHIPCLPLHPLSDKRSEARVWQILPIAE